MDSSGVWSLDSAAQRYLRNRGATLITEIEIRPDPEKNWWLTHEILTPEAAARGKQ